MQNAGQDEAQAGIKIARKNINNLRYADDMEKVSFHSNPKERQCQKMLTTAQLHSSYTLVK